jgi:hypothetical protein
MSIDRARPSGSRRTPLNFMRLVFAGAPCVSPGARVGRPSVPVRTEAATS